MGKLIVPNNSEVELEIKASFPVLEREDNIDINAPLLLSIKKQSTSKDIYLRTIRWIAHEAVITRATNWISSGSSQHVIKADAFYQGSSTFLYTIWPVLFLALLFQDFIMFSLRPHDRYQTTAVDILLGTATNQLTITSQLGTDLAGEYQYLLWPSLLAVAPLLLGMLNIIRQLRWHHTLTTEECEELVDQLNNAINNRDFWNGGRLFSKTEYALARARVAILWNKYIEIPDRDKLVIAVINLAKYGRGLTQLSAIAVLADIAANKAAPLNLGGEQKLAKSVLLTLVKLPQAVPIHKILLALPRYLIAQFVSWKTAYNDKLSAQLFWLIPLYIVLVNARLWELWLNKIRGKLAYLTAQTQCETSGRYWTYNKRIANYLCSLCEDWSVYPTDINNPQKCLDGFLNQPQTPQAIFTALQRLWRFSKQITKIDLSQQAWLSWNATDFSYVLEYLEPFSNLTSLNLSYVRQLPEWLPDNKLTILNIYLQNSTITQLDVSHLHLGPARATSLFANSNMQSLQDINLSANELDDTAFAELLPKLPKTLRWLNISNNLAGSDTVIHIAALLKTSECQHFDLSYNKKLTAVSLTQLNSSLASSQLSQLRLRGIAQNSISVASITQHQPISLQLLDISEAQLTDNAITSFQVGNLATIIVDNNNLTDNGLKKLARLLQNSSVNFLSIANNHISGGSDAWTALAAVSSLQELAINMNDLSGADPAALANLLLQLRRINLNNTRLTSNVLHVLANNILQVMSKLQHIELANNLIDNTVVDVIQTLLKTNLTYLDLSNNPFDSAMAYGIAEILTNCSCQLRTLKLSQTQIDNLGAQQLFQALPYSNLDDFEYADNMLNSNDMPYVIAGLIETPWPTPYLLQDGDLDLSIDERRALQRIAPSSKIHRLDVHNNDLSLFDQRLLDRLAPPLGFPAGGLTNYNDNLYSRVTANNHPLTLVTDTTTLSFSLVLPIVGAAFLLLLLLHYTRPYLTTAYRWVTMKRTDRGDNDIVCVAPSPSMR